MLWFIFLWATRYDGGDIVLVERMEKSGKMSCVCLMLHMV